MNDFAAYLKKAGDYHGHVCAGIALGTKMTLTALEALGMDPDLKNKNLIVYAEIDRCMTDAVQVITGCTLGHRSLKYVDYGKFAATFVDIDKGKAIRVTVKESFDSTRPIGELTPIIEQIAAEEMISLKEVIIDIPDVDLPGFPKKKANCSVCGERIMDGRDMTRGGEVLCRACAGAKYYTEMKTKTQVTR